MCVFKLCGAPRHLGQVLEACLNTFQGASFLLAIAVCYARDGEFGSGQSPNGIRNPHKPEEGLERATADAAPRDGQIVLDEWLDYAAARVPELQAARLDQARLLQHELAFVPGDEKRAWSRRPVQHPRVFYRREPGATPFIVARVAASRARRP